MGKSAVQMLEQPTKLAAVNFQKTSEANFSTSLPAGEQSIAERISEKLVFNARFVRLRRRMKKRSSNIL